MTTVSVYITMFYANIYVKFIGCCIILQELFSTHCVSPFSLEIFMLLAFNIFDLHRAIMYVYICTCVYKSGI